MTRILLPLVLGALTLFPAAQAARLTGSHSLSGINQTCASQGEGYGFIDQNTVGCAEYIGSGTFFVSGSGQASYDTLRASASVGIEDLDPSGFISNTGILGRSFGGSSYNDAVVIDIPGRTGETVELEFVTAMNGTLSAIGDSDFVFSQASAVLRVLVNGYTVSVSRNAKNAGTNVNNDFNPGRVEIVLGAPFTVDADLLLEARIQRNIGNTQFFTGDAVSAFSNSAGITSFMLYEAGQGGALISDWDMTSESGEFGFYTAVPIPGAVWLFGSAIGILGWMRRKQSV